MADINRAKETIADQYTEHADIMPGGDGDEDENAILAKIDRRAKALRAGLDPVFKEYDINRRYYKGDQLNFMDLFAHETPIVVNRIFSAIETIIPVATKSTPEANIRISPVEKRTLRIKTKEERELKDVWEIKQRMPLKMRIALRHWAMARFWCIKVVWNPDKDSTDWLLMPPGKVLFPVNATSEDEMNCVIEYVKSTYGEMKEKFPDKADALYNALQSNDVNDDTEITYEEYWENDKACYKYKNVYLGSENNPNWNDMQSDFLDKNNEPINFFSKPKHPYIFGGVYGMGESVLDEIATITQGRPLQDGINKRKRQIEQNADQANGQWVIAGNAMSKENLPDLRRNPNGIIYLDKADTVVGMIDKISGKAFDQTTLQDMDDSKNELDSLFGTNSNLRGEREQQETATGRAILKQSDTDRIGGSISVAIEDFASRAYAYELQMQYVYATKRRQILSMPEGRDYELSEFDKENYIDREEFRDLKMHVLVNAGSTVTRDENVRRAEVIDLTNAGHMSKLDMYKELGYSNPEKLAFNAIMEAQDPTIIYGSMLEPENYSVEAVRDLLAIQKGEVEAGEIRFDSQDPKEWSAYLKTNENYMRGVEVDEDLIPFQSLDIEGMAAISQHIRQAAMDGEMFVNTQPLPEMAPEQPVPEQPPVAPQSSAVEGAGLDSSAMAGQPNALPTAAPVDTALMGA